MSDAPQGVDPEEAEVSDLSDEGIQGVAEGISRLTARRKSLRPTVASIHADSLSGESVQSRVGDLIREIDSEGEVILALRVLDNFGVEEVVDECASRELIEEDIADLAPEVLNDISWIFPAADAILQNSRDEYYWTDSGAGIAGRNEKGKLLIGQRANHGVDELWDVQAPIMPMLSQQLQTMGQVIARLRNLPPAVELDEEELQELETFADALSEFADETEAAIEDITRTNESPDISQEDIEDFEPEDLLE